MWVVRTREILYFLSTNNYFTPAALTQIKYQKQRQDFDLHSAAVTADSLVQNQEALKYFLPVGLKYFFRNAGNIFPAWLATIHTGLD